jgi:hypothetical protein
VLNVSTWDFTYTGGYQHFVVPQTGSYRLEAWGAQGGVWNSDVNKGGYTAGTITLTQGQIVYIYVGQAGITASSYAPSDAPLGYILSEKAFNGGGAGNIATTLSYGGIGCSGGGATDFRLLPGDTDTEWDKALSLNTRIMVAAGGGGGSGYTAGSRIPGYGGGLIGGKGLNRTNPQISFGGNQTGSSNYTDVWGGSFGVGGSCLYFALGEGSGGGSGGGGGGYYGGDGNKSRPADAGTGSGGSSFISGMKGCVAIDPATTTDPRTQDTGNNTTALNYTSAFGTSPTWSDGDEILFTNPSMIDGAGYEWNNGTQGSSPTKMPNPAGGASITGNTGNGYARITRLN